MQGDRVREVILSIISNSQTPLETQEILERVLQQTTRTIVFRRLTDLREKGEIFGGQIGSGKGAWIWWKKELLAQKIPTPVTDDKIAQQVLETVFSSQAPLETKQIEDIVQKATPTTRTIIFKRLTDLRGDGTIEGQHIGSGKGTWIWWSKEPTTAPPKIPFSDDKISQKVIETVFSAHTPLETKQVEEIVRDAIPATRTKIFKRLVDLRGDQILRGRVVGSGKGTWIWWRENAAR